MANITDWLKKAEENNGEQITAIVVGPHDRDDRWSGEDRRPADKRNVVLSRKDGLALLDAQFDNGYGGADCFAMYAWSESWVYSISEYDGATGLAQLPRHPVNCEPTF